MLRDEIPALDAHAVGNHLGALAETFIEGDGKVVQIGKAFAFLGEWSQWHVVISLSLDERDTQA